MCIYIYSYRNSAVLYQLCHFSCKRLEDNWHSGLSSSTYVCTLCLRRQRAASRAAQGYIFRHTYIHVCACTYEKALIFVGGWVFPCAGFPPVLFPPCGVSPLRCLAGALCGSGWPRACFHSMGTSAEPSGVGTPDSGWQQPGRRGRATAALSSTTPADTTAGTTAGRQQFYCKITQWLTRREVNQWPL